MGEIDCGLRLVELAGVATLRFDASSLLPATLAAMSIAQIESIRMPNGYLLGELFSVDGKPSNDVRIECRRITLDNLGAGMAVGTIQLVGDAGHNLGLGMAGGSIHVLGKAGDAAGAGMKRGRIRIEKHAGDRLGAVSPVSGRGMRGGELIVGGDAGDDVGERMRRGVIYVAGAAGERGATRMVAGTIVVRGGIGAGWARQMRRGSIILARDSEETWGATLSKPYEFELSFLPLLWNFLRSCVDPHFPVPTARWAQRRVGDLECGGMGEVLTLARQSQ